MVAVRTSSKSLHNFLPVKKVLNNDIAMRNRFFIENGLLSAAFGVPFVAGLLDGDGYCQVQLRRRRVYFEQVGQSWKFIQGRYLFLVDYLKEFVGSFALDSFHVRKLADGTTEFLIRKSGVEALLGAGIAEYSWRVADWLRRISEARSERAGYYTVGDVAQILGACSQTVRGWLKSGRMNHIGGQTSVVGGRRVTLSWNYIPISEVERFKEKLLREDEKVKKMKNDAVRLVDVARMLCISRNTLYNLYLHGKLRATLMREVHRGLERRNLMIPRGEVERLMKKYQPREVNQNDE